MKSKKNLKKNKNKNKRLTKRHKKYIYGGVNVKDNYCHNSNEKCKFLDKNFPGKINPTWSTCINMNDTNNNILYVTSSNVLIKSIESLQIPEFYVSLKNNVSKCKIMIEDKYVNCFIYMCGKWYAMMRLFGKTVNVQYLARTEKNRAFYELRNINVKLNPDNPDDPNTNSLITIPENSYTVLNKSSKLLSTNKNAEEIKLNEGYFKNINKTNDRLTFNVLQRFRQQKLVANDIKTNIAFNAFKELLGF